jgi:prepilin-type N-terminal cleavage/methylation domain-containing protein
VRSGRKEAFLKAAVCRRGGRAFTLVEIMVAVAVFAVLMGSVYACWMSVVRGTNAGKTAAVASQRARVAVRALEQAFLTAQMFADNYQYYSFIADSKDERFSTVEFVSRLPDTFLGGGYFGNQVVRRVAFYPKRGEDNKINLVMAQVPLLDANERKDPYEIVLARDVTRFNLEFWRPGDKDFDPQFIETNKLPKLVRITLAIGHAKNSSDNTPAQLIVRLVNIPSEAVTTRF